MNDRKIQALTGRKPKFFRAGTAYYDDVAVKIVNDIGERAVNFDILGDAGATYTTEQVKNSLLTAKPGSIVILHFNQPAKDTAEGMMKAIPLLLQKGYLFVKLEDYL
jgi:peptidoglycan/xylan/chitin deacetylase (PgdA/CDA1 family)